MKIQIDFTTIVDINYFTVLSIVIEMLYYFCENIHKNKKCNILILT